MRAMPKAAVYSSREMNRARPLLKVAAVEVVDEGLEDGRVEKKNKVDAP